MDFTEGGLELAPLTVDIRGNNSDFKSAMAETKALGSKTSRGVENDFKNSSGGIGKAFSAIGGAVQAAGKKVSGFGSGIQNVGKGAQKVGSNLTSHITKPLLGIGGALAGVTAFQGFNRIMETDTAQAKLKGLGYSTQEVGEISEDVTEAIEGGMTTVAEGTDIAAGAMAAGVEQGDELQKYIQLVGDAAVGSGRDVGEMATIFNRVEGQGKLMTEELNMIEDGMPGFSNAMAEHLGVSMEAFRDMVTEGEVSSEEFKEVMDDFAGGMAEEYAKSFQGMAKNAKNYIGQIGEAFLNGGEDTKGFFDQLKPMMEDLNNWLQDLVPKAEDFGRKFGEAFANMVDRIKGVKQWYDSLTKAQQQLTLKVAGFGTAALAFLGPVITIAGKLLVPFGGLIKVVGSAITWVGSLATSLGGLLGPIGLAVGVVTAIGLAFGAAKNDGDLLKGAFDGLKNGAKGIVEWFGQLADATKEWGENLNFEPITNSFKNLSGSLKPFTQNIFDGLRWGYENVLLPLAGFVIEDALPAFFDALGGAIDFVNGVVEGLKPAWDFLWNEVLVPLGDWAAGAAVTTLEGVGDALSGIGNFISEHQEGFSTFVITFGSFAAALKVISMVSTAVTVINGVVGAIAAMGGLTGILSAVGTGIMGIITMLGGPWALAIAGAVAVGVLLWKNWDTIKQYADPIIGAVKGIFGVLVGPLVRGVNTAITVGKWLYGNWDTIRQKASDMVGGIKQKWGEFKENTSTKWSEIKEDTKAKWSSVSQSIREKASGAVAYAKSKWADLKANTSSKWSEIKADTSSKWSSINRSIRGKTAGAVASAKSKWSELKADTSSKWSDIKANTSSKWSTIKDKIGSAAKSGKDSAAGHWKNLKKNTSDTFDTVVGWAKKLPERIGDGIQAGKKWIKNAFKNIFEGAVKIVKVPVNAIISGASWILEKFGADKLDSWEPKLNYKKGTNNNGHPGGSAMVNDGRGAEAVIPPNGNAFIPRGKNVFMPNMPRGTHVLNAQDTADVYGDGKPKYRYAFGTGLLDKAKDFGSSALSGIKNLAKSAADKIGDVWDFISDPSKLVEKVIAHFVGFDGMSDLPLEYGKTFVSKAKDKMFDWVKGLFDEYGSMGEFDGKMGKSGKWKVYDYLWDVAQKVLKKFPGMSGVTSGYRPGDPNHHGKHQAIDVAYPASMNGSSKYTEAGNWAFKNFPNQLAYVIANNKIKDRVGSGGQGVTNSWKNWPSGGHLNHMHLSGKYGPGDVGKGGDGFAGGSGVGRWKNTAIQALKMTGNHSAGNLKLLMNQMRSESNGNPKAINNWDSNARRGTPSKGLMQVIDPTFQSNKYPGRGNIWNPLDNILAAIRYTKKQYGSLAAGWRSVGYANGGFVTSKTYFAGERGPEAILPLDDKERSEEIIAQSLKYMNTKMPEPAPFDGYNASLNKTKKTIHADGSQHSAGNSQSSGDLGELIGLMKGILEKENVVEMNIDGNEISRATWKYDERNMQVEKGIRNRLNGGRNING
ncbi:tape measure protein [Tetragenococcus halophilus]|uniref:tape measure protein n=1 Tax=Tetragenococcus halophilus TaxID=51669 RepID=UPI00209A9AED|nr:transglycosylase SLT domain-containing protein [Tetragenococcus halophilus]